MRIMILEDDATHALAIQRQLVGRHELSFCTTIAEALTRLSSGTPPDVIVADLNLPDSSGVDTLAALKAAAPLTPVIASTGHAGEGLKERVEAFGASLMMDKNKDFQLLETLLKQADIMHQTITAHRVEILKEIDVIAGQAAERVVNQAIKELTSRLGLCDEEGLRMAVRLARGWETTKTRFVQALATGIASALLLALGSGVIAILRNHGSK